MRRLLGTAAAAALAACGPGASPPVANDDRVAVLLGTSATLDALLNDTAAGSTLDIASVEIVAGPLAGIVKVDPANGTITYRHNGISAAPDAFSYRLKSAAGTLSNTATVTVLVSISDARVEIVQPVADAEVRGDTLTVNYTVAGAGFNHLHLSIDGVGHNTIKDLTGTYTFEGVAPGAHVVTADLVDADHRPINAPRSKDSVNVTVVP